MSTTPPGKSVLVVDDDGLTRSALVMALECAGYKVHQASDGREAFRVLHTAPPPSAILLDVVMPHMNGWEFLRERDANDPGLSDIPVIVFSIRERGSFLNVLTGEGVHTVIGQESCA